MSLSKSLSSSCAFGSSSFFSSDLVSVFFSSVFVSDFVSVLVSVLVSVFVSVDEDEPLPELLPEPPELLLPDEEAGGGVELLLDVGGGASPEKMVKAFKLISQDEKVKVILVNIFAGINRCDWVAEGIIQALEKIKIDMPLVIRLAGTNVEKGNKILKESKINYIEASTLEDAANKAVKALKELGKN